MVELETACIRGRTFRRVRWCGRVSTSSDNLAHEIKIAELNYNLASISARSYITTLEKQLSSLRTELSDLYKSQSTSQARQLAMADTLRDRDEEVRRLSEEVRVVTESKERLLRRDREWEERWKMKEADVQVGCVSAMLASIRGCSPTICYRHCTTKCYRSL
jgi:septation ring formation regulator EzrA